MKLILSRKGFDGGAKSGGCPSPIFDDGTMFSLPIPDNPDFWITYDDLHCPKADVGELVQDLTGAYATKVIKATHGAHLDPHVSLATYSPQVASADWRGLFGQAAQAQGHLANQGVKEGDLFLFFGLYRRVEWKDGGWLYTDDPEQHVLWGWLQIEKTIKVAEARGQGNNPPGVSYHPHWQDYGDENPRNTLYVAREKLDIGDGLEAPGAGVFPRFDDRMLLTVPGESVSHWKLPRWFYPDGNKKPLTYHRNRSRVPKSPQISPDPWEPLWKPNNDDYAYLESVGRGQEFVLDCDHYPEAVGWARGLIRDLGAK